MNSARIFHAPKGAEPALAEMVNDRHSQLNPTVIARIEKPTCTADLIKIVAECRASGEKICIAGGRHAMGGQQFAEQGVLIDTVDMIAVHEFDRGRGLIKVDAGIRWPRLIDYLRQAQLNASDEVIWTIRQKQTGCDTLSIGGALSANVHGRGLQTAPIVSDVQSFELVTASGDLIFCDRGHNPELFGLAIGGYGMFGIIATVTLRLTPIALLRRSVQLATAQNAVALLEQAASKGAQYGDFQFNIDHTAADFLQGGILSTYAPVTHKDNVNDKHQPLSIDDWHDLVFLAHTDKTRAFQKYQRHYLASHGQNYWSDTFQLATYLDDYHRHIDNRLAAPCQGTEMISELYVPRQSLALFLQRAATMLRAASASVIYGTVRLIEKDAETFMPWATDRWACVVLNLHVDHSPQGLAAARLSFCRLIDLAIELSGTYYLTYHRWASSRQLQACYPQFQTFILQKQRHDPTALFYSDWFASLSEQIRQIR